MRRHLGLFDGGTSVAALNIAEFRGGPGGRTSKDKVVGLSAGIIMFG